MKKNLIWNVYYKNINKKEIEKYNIFKHGGFNKYLNKIFKEFKTNPDKIEFAERLRKELFYFFGSKCEWEIIISKKEDHIIIKPWTGIQDIEFDVTYDKEFDWLGFYNKMTERYTKKNNDIKVDVYDQVRYYWDEFVEYCWKNRK